MFFKNKLEEDKVYAPLFVLLSAVLMAVLIWVIVDETVTSRPWKGYQKRFYKLEQDFLSNKIMEEASAFQKSDKYKEYQALKVKLTNAETIFNSDSVQEKFKALKAELRKVVKKELKPVTSKLIAARNEKLAVEFQYGKNPGKRDYYLGEIADFDSKIEDYAGKQAALIKKKDSITQNIALISADVDRNRVELKQYTKIVDAFSTRLEAVKRKGPTLQIYQTYIKEINLADRCMSCHAGIDKEESVSDENPFKAHPNRDYYLGNHPVSEFGCVSCHEGQGRALTSVEEAHGEVEYWLTPLLRGNYAQSSCTKCHGLDSDLEEGAPLLVKGKELFTKRGCYRCHVTKGFKETELKERTGPDLTNVAYSTKPEWLIKWIQNPKHVRPDTPMPNFDFSREEAEAIASYLWQTSDRKSSGSVNKNFGQDVVSNGATLFADKGCYVCHRNGEEGSEFAPNLFNIGEKLNYEYTVKWLLDPKSFQPKTVMPSFRLNKDEASSLAAYLSTLKAKEGMPVVGQILVDPENAEKGKLLIMRYGCFSCHKIKGMEGVGRIGVELSKIGSKSIHFLDFGLLEHEILHKIGLKHGEENVVLTRRAWLKEKLHEPRIFDEGRYKKPKDKLRMPNFEFNDEDIHALTIFLTSLVKQKIPHSMVAKPTQESIDLYEGFKVVKKFNCIGCHQFSLDTVKLKDGTIIEGIVKKEKKGKMYFQLWKDSPELKKTAGKTVRFNISDIVTHTKGVGGIVAPLLVESLKNTHGISEKEAVNYLPPKLYGQGKKTQPDWLFSFLKSPVILRPWYKAVMPTFNMTDEEDRKIVKYFSVRDEASYPFEFIKEKDKRYLAGKEKEVTNYMSSAKALFNSPTVNCISCHIRGDIMPEGKPADWAPDLSIANNRLRPGWITNWLKDPQGVQPGTKMPTFFSEGMYQEILPGNPEFQIQAIMAFLMNFDDSTSNESPNAALNLKDNINNINLDVF
ncbi:MAG: c-type cytochrome [Candidatus Anammoxibacter sp.]